MKKTARLATLLSFAVATGFPGAHASEPETTPEPLTLGEAHAIALRNHPQVVMANLRGLIAQEEVKQNQAAYYPTAVAYADAVEAGNRNTIILAGAVTNSSVYDRVADGISVSELLTDFGQTRNRLASARLSAKAEIQNVAATDQQILLNVDANYFYVLQGEAVLRVARQTVDARRILVDQVTALERNQLKSALDVSFAEVAYEQAELLLQKAQGDADGAQAGLAASLGYGGARRFQPADEPPPPSAALSEDNLIDAAIENRPDLLRLGYERDAALRLARAEKDRNYPTVEAVGEFGNALSHDYRLPDKYAVGAVTMNFPLFAGGSYMAREHEAELQAQIAEQALRDERDNVSRDVRLAWLNFNTAAQRVSITEELLKHANEAFALAQARYRVGSSSIVELTDAQVNATSAQIADANARYDELIQQSILNYQTGSMR
jgi:outer membrane protein